MKYFEIVSICENGILAEDFVFLEWKHELVTAQKKKILCHLDLDYSVTQRHSPKGRYLQPYGCGNLETRTGLS